MLKQTNEDLEACKVWLVAGEEVSGLSAYPAFQAFEQHHLPHRGPSNDATVIFTHERHALRNLLWIVWFDYLTTVKLPRNLMEDRLVAIDSASGGGLSTAGGVMAAASSSAAAWGSLSGGGVRTSATSLTGDGSTASTPPVLR